MKGVELACCSTPFLSVLAGPVSSLTAQKLDSSSVAECFGFVSFVCLGGLACLLALLCSQIQG